ncbi:nuclear pore-associated protein 1-like isoform X2 [Hylobates moloch]|uniref:nuclear pore-associated protein 1-like isoform X2 n=1 Tax=Hylobates moloch TaxID=81572 RepID=UPI0026773D9E|nr:nuclear pore-associated protein 1-like isoform X2 [Hylobates moloch]
MGNLLSIFCPWSRRRPLPGRRPQAPIARESSQPGRAHPAAPTSTPGPFRFLFNPQRSRGPSPVSFYSAPRRPCPLPPDTGAPLGVLPAVGFGLPSRKKPVLSARNSMMLGHPSSVRIPPPRSKFTLQLPSPREQVVRDRKLIPIPARLPNKTKDIHIQGPGDPGRPQFLQVQSGAPGGKCLSQLLDRK